MKGKIYTSYYAVQDKTLNKIGPDVELIAISRGVPYWFKGSKKKLGIIPSQELIDLIKTGDNGLEMFNLINMPKEFGNVTYTKSDMFHKWMYTLLYREQLALLRQDDVYSEIGEGNCAFCFEKVGDFCHRNIFAEWMREADYEVEEVTFN